MKFRVFFFLIILCTLHFLSCSNDDLGITVITPDDNDSLNLEGRIVCKDGFASIYPCQNYDLLARITTEDLNATANNDIWGWTDPLDGSEYALVGTIQATVFIDITLGDAPRIIGSLLSATSTSTWRDIKVYNNHAFIVSEAENHGMQVFDLTRLRNQDNEEPVAFDADARYSEFGNAHNIVINEESGFAYAVGTSSFNGGPHIVNIQNPLNPFFAGGYEMAGYSHDAQAVTYKGPDKAYQGQEIYVGSNGDEVVIIDVTDKTNPILISSVGYPDIGYAHQGWLSEDHTIFYLNDERDENQFGYESRTLIFDFTDLDNPFFVSPFFGPTQAIDHNLYVHGDELFLSNYAAGLRVADISDKTTPFDIGFFDTFPDNDNTAFSGVWSVYPYFTSGNIIINDVTEGFFVIRKTGT